VVVVILMTVVVVLVIVVALDAVVTIPITVKFLFAYISDELTCCY
jgi:hypothetical protein